MEQHQILESAVFAAGLAAVYNADDWARIADARPRHNFEDDELPHPIELPH
jgi:hypothetical protein